MESSRLQLNEDKCIFMILNMSKTQPIVNIKIKNKPIKQVSEMKILGLVIDDKLSFLKHAKYVSSKCHNALWSLAPLRPILCIKTKKTLVHALVFSILNYVSCIWMRPKNNQAIAYKVIRAGTRFIYNKAKYESLCDIINVDLSYLHPKYGYDYEVLKIAFKFYSGQCPDYFIHYLLNTDNNTTVKTTRNKSYIDKLVQNKRKFNSVHSTKSHTIMG